MLTAIIFGLALLTSCMFIISNINEHRGAIKNSITFNFILLITSISLWSWLFYLLH